MNFSDVPLEFIANNFLNTIACRFVKATSPRLSLGITAALILLPCGVFLEGLVHSAHAFNFNEDRIDHICWVPT